MNALELTDEVDEDFAVDGDDAVLDGKGPAREFGDAKSL